VASAKEAVVPQVKKQPAQVREVTLAVGNQSFDEIVEILRRVWVVPELPGIKGCDPCRSGLDRLIIEDAAIQGIRR
jgi:hypothetical protein